MAHPVFLTLWASMAAFGAYFCMYMYRKPYAAALFEGQMLFGLDYKIVLIISQVAGYACSKFLGIRIISSMKPDSRAYYYIGLIGIALTGLSLFYFSNPVWSMLWLFINGLALGLIWGVVFQYLEGRSITELLTVILSANFIFTSGVAKTIGVFFLTILSSVWYFRKNDAHDDWLDFCPIDLTICMDVDYDSVSKQIGCGATN